MMVESNERELETGIHTDLSGRMSYAGYLRLDQLLSAQQRLSDPPHHDEMLFIVQHQVSELWMKLLIHELKAALVHLRADELGACQKIFARCKGVLRQLTEMWSVLETLTPSEYMQFRDILGPSSGFQSLQYRTIEFLLGNKNAAMLKVFAHDEWAATELREVLQAPGLYDEVLRYLARHGHAVPAGHVERDWSKPHVSDPALLPVFERIYEDTDTHWAAFIARKAQAAEQLSLRDDRNRRSRDDDVCRGLGALAKIIDDVAGYGDGAGAKSRSNKLRGWSGAGNNSSGCCVGIGERAALRAGADGTDIDVRAGDRGAGVGAAGQGWGIKCPDGEWGSAGGLLLWTIVSDLV